MRWKHLIDVVKMTASVCYGEQRFELGTALVPLPAPIGFSNHTECEAPSL
jgi:hypothetical protein